MRQDFNLGIPAAESMPLTTSQCYSAVRKETAVSSFETSDDGWRLNAERQMCLKEEKVCKSKAKKRKEKKNGAKKTGKASVRPSGEFMSESCWHQHGAIVPFFCEARGTGRL